MKKVISPNSSTIPKPQPVMRSSTHYSSDGLIDSCNVNAQDSKNGCWPRQVDLFGVPVSPTNYEEATQAIISAAKRREGGLVSCHAVHAIITFCSDSDLRQKISQFDMITPDGQPVRWALNLLHGTHLQDRVYGPELTLRVCAAAASSKNSIYLYGGSPEVIEKLQANLKEQFPELEIAGAESPPFRTLTASEDSAVVERINSSGAGIVLIGLGCPKQDLFAYEHRDLIKPVQMCVGAAFDFHAGAKSKAPEWMQNRGLEWLFRLCCEPRRLWKRYLVTNSQFVTRLAIAAINFKKTRQQRAATRDASF